MGICRVCWFTVWAAWHRQKMRQHVSVQKCFQKWTTRRPYQPIFPHAPNNLKTGDIERIKPKARTKYLQRGTTNKGVVTEMNNPKTARENLREWLGNSKNWKISSDHLTLDYRLWVTNWLRHFGLEALANTTARPLWSNLNAERPDTLEMVLLQSVFCPHRVWGPPDEGPQATQSTGGGGWVRIRWRCWVVVEEKRSSHRNESMLLAKEHMLKPRLTMCFTGVKTTRQT